MLLFLALACTSPRDTGASDSGADDTASDTADDTGLDACEDCFSACGVPLRPAPGYDWSGFTLVSGPDAAARAAAWQGEHVVGVGRGGLVVRDRDLAEVGSLPPAPLSVAVAVVGDVAVDGQLALTDVSDPANPVAVGSWARPAGDGWVRLAGRSGDRLVLSTSGGVSFLDVSDPSTPVEARCVPLEDGLWPWAVEVDDDHLVVAVEAAAPEARVYDLRDPSAPTVLPVGMEQPVVLSGDRLAVWASHDEVVRYDLTDAGPVERDRLSGDPRLRPRFDLPRAGGVALHHWSEDGAWAIDLQADVLALSPWDGDELAWCAATVGSDPAVTVYPVWDPSGRYDAGDAPWEACPGAPLDVPVSRPVARSPDGDRLLISEGGTWVRVDLDGGDRDPVDVDADRGWWLDGALVFAETTGWDWGQPVETTLTVLPDDAEPVRVDAPGPLVDAAASAGRLWVLSEPGPRDFGDDPPPPGTNLLWSVDADGARHEAPLSGVAPVGLHVVDDEVWVLDASGELVVLGVDGVERERRPLPSGFRLDDRAASSLGLFLADDAGQLWWVSDDGALTAVGAPGLVPLAADGTHVHVAASVPDHPGWTGFRELRRLIPAEEPEVTGRWPLDSARPQVLPGEELVLVDRWVFVLGR